MRGLAAIVIGVVVAAFGGPTPAHAGRYAPPDPGRDEVVLTSGGLVRGTIVEVEPRSHVTVLVGGTGQTRRIPWGEVDDVLRGKYGSAPSHTAAPGRPRLHIEVEGRAQVGLFREDDQTKICDAPCDTVVDGREGEMFVLDGPRMSPSLAFVLVDKPKEVRLIVRPGRRGLSVAGWTLIGIGAAAILAGGVTLTLADDDRAVRRGGGFTLLGGLPLTIGGAIMAAYGRTRYRFAAPGHATAKKKRRRRR